MTSAPARQKEPIGPASKFQQSPTGEESVELVAVYKRREPSIPPLNATDITICWYVRS